MLMTAPIEVRLWRRFVDDSLAVLKRGEEDTLLSHLNDCHENINFTEEKEENDHINFLDITITRSGTEKVRTTVYRKSTATDRYLDFRSAHSSGSKWGIVSCLRKRAESICRHPDDLQAELIHLESIFLKNGFPRKGLKKRLWGDTNFRREDGENTHFLQIPYIQGVSEKVQRAITKLNLKLQVRFSRGWSLGSALMSNKLDRLPPLEVGGVIYKQACEDCNLVYIGETSRRGSIRRREHSNDVKNFNMRSAIAEHCHNFGHKVDFNTFSILAKEKVWHRRKIKESIQIVKHKTMNRDEGIGLDKCWKSLIS